MSDTIRLVIEGIDNVDAMQLREALEEKGAAAEFSERPFRPLGLGQHGAADLINLAIELATITIPAVSAGVALWLTRRQTKVTEGNVVFAVEGDKMVYQRFGASEVSQSSDPEQISAALHQRLAPASKHARAAKGRKGKEAEATATARRAPQGRSARNPRQAKTPTDAPSEEG
jgi:hypothetical protein